MSDYIDIYKWYIYRDNEISKVKEYLEGGGNINKTDNDNWTPLHYATYNERYEIVEFLITEGAKINIKDKLGCTSLHYACRYGYYEIANYLINEGAKINMKDKFGCTPLHYAAANGKDDIAKLLIANNVDVTIRNRYKETAYDEAKRNGHNSIMQLLDEADQTRDESENKNQSSLTKAKTSDKKRKEKAEKRRQDNQQKKKSEMFDKKMYGDDNVDKIQEYVKGCDVHKTDEFGSAPLHYAALFGSKEIALYLISKGAKVDMQDNDGYTPLHWASYKGRYEIVEVLIAHNADTTIKDNFGETASGYAKENGYTRIMELLHSEEMQQKINKLQNSVNTNNELQDKFVLMLKLITEKQNYIQSLIANQCCGKTAQEIFANSAYGLLENSAMLLQTYSNDNNSLECRLNANFNFTQFCGNMAACCLSNIRTEIPSNIYTLLSTNQEKFDEWEKLKATESTRRDELYKELSPVMKELQNLITFASNKSEIMQMINSHDMLIDILSSLITNDDDDDDNDDYINNSDQSILFENVANKSLDKIVEQFCSVVSKYSVHTVTALQKIRFHAKELAKACITFDEDVKLSLSELKQNLSESINQLKAIELEVIVNNRKHCLQLIVKYWTSFMDSNEENSTP